MGLIKLATLSLIYKLPCVKFKLYLPTVESHTKKKHKTISQDKLLSSLKFSSSINNIS